MIYIASKKCIQVSSGNNLTAVSLADAVHFLQRHFYSRPICT